MSHDPAELIRWRIEERRPGRAILVIQCRHGVDGECRRSLWMPSAQGIMWQWCGSKGAPTITPSINCQGGCGRHFTITNGVTTNG